MTPHVDREQLGRLVRRVWVSWAREQPDPKPSWLLDWDDLDESLREVDRRIGEAVANAAFEAAMGVRVPGDSERKIEVQSGYGANSKEPFVTLTLPGPETRIQLRAHEARDLAQNLIEGAEAALTDGLIVEFFVRHIGLGLPEVAPILNQLRAFRLRKSKEGT
jgi:hypothetical protein